MDTSLKSYRTFLAAGTLFSTVEEFLTIVVLKGDLGSYLFTLIVLFPLFLTVVFVSGRIIDCLPRNQPHRDLIHFLFYGFVGLMIEWFLIGLSPWSNPKANPLLMLLFQLGMFCFWATVSFAPRLFIRNDEHSVKSRRTVLRFFLTYFLFVYIVVFTVPANARFAVTIILIEVGYCIVAVALVRYMVRHRWACPAEGRANEMQRE